VNRSIFFAAGIIIAGFIPLFYVERRGGPHLRPDGAAYAYALAGGLIATFTVTPALSALIIARACAGNRNVRGASPASRLHAIVEFLDPSPGHHVGGAIVMIALAGFRRSLAGLGVFAKLEEGNLWIRATLPSTIFVGGRQHLHQRMRRVVSTFRRWSPSFRSRGAGRRHRRRRFLQRRVFRAAQTDERMAPQDR